MSAAALTIKVGLGLRQAHPSSGWWGQTYTASIWAPRCSNVVVIFRCIRDKVASEK